MIPSAEWEMSSGGVLVPAVPADYRAHWTGVNVSGASLIDESASSYHGTITGAVVSGDYLEFDGTDDKVALPTTSHPGSASTTANTWTHVFTFDADDVGGGAATRRIWAARKAIGPSTDSVLWLYDVGADILRVTTGGSPTATTNEYLTYTQSVSANTRYTVIVELDNKTRRIYINDSLVDTATHTNDLYGALTNYLGANRNGGGHYYDGGTRLVYIYDRVLTADEKTAIFSEAA